MVEQVLLELKRGKKLYDFWKQGQASQEGHRSVLCIHRQKTQKLRAEIGLFMPGNKKVFMHINNRRRSKENISLMLVKGGHVTKRMKKTTQIFNAFFASVLTNTDWATGCPETEDQTLRTVIFCFWTLIL